MKQKVKTRKSIAKRFKFTKTGKILRRQTNQDHGRMKMTAKQRRQGRRWISVSHSEQKRIKQSLAS